MSSLCVPTDEERRGAGCFTTAVTAQRKPPCPGSPRHACPPTTVGADPQFAEARLDEWQHDFSIFYALVEWPGATRPNRGVPTGSVDYQP